MEGSVNEKAGTALSVVAVVDVKAMYKSGDGGGATATARRAASSRALISAVTPDGAVAETVSVKVATALAADSVPPTVMPDAARLGRATVDVVDVVSVPEAG